jgi:hypothetical protein
VILKLSALQCMILAMLFQDEWNVSHNKERGTNFRLKSRCEFNEMFYRDYFGCDKDPSRLPSAKASLSRAFRRLEEQGMVKRKLGHWLLTDMSDGMYNGMTYGILEYGKLIELRKRLKNTNG